NLDTCPMGVATQNPELRKRFMGKPEYVENFMLFVARQLREYMAKLGVRSVDELVGRTDLLKKKEGLSGAAKRVDLSNILYRDPESACTFDERAVYDFDLAHTKDEAELLQDEKIRKAIGAQKKAEVAIRIGNTDRAFGTLLGSAITMAHPAGLPDDTVKVNCMGAAGQSFGAFIPAGLTLDVTGDANDYLGKGLSGGKIILKAPEDAGYEAEDNMIAGNVALYGATGGEVYIAGMAGERFCVRNSGATAVVEGVGEHGCEYMTGGRCVILGPTGKNFAAGMSGGIAYVYDKHNRLYKNLNKEMVFMEQVETKTDREELKKMLEDHVRYTGSQKAAQILADFEAELTNFKKIIPEDYKKLIVATGMYEEQGMSHEDAQIEAFYECTGQQGR
ncbi:MAG: glutamate synthase subunit alpha, partial [Lachnospiraceae bacterium]|nr:glutamate synthase subunit alpha [Lachnospiraceae bacterium]